MKTATLELLRADSMDSGGDIFTKECLQEVVANFVPGVVSVYPSFNQRGPGDILGTITYMYLDGDRLMATVEFLDNEKGKASAFLVEQNALELAAGGQVMQNVVGYNNGKSMVVSKFKLHETALVPDKVK